MEEYKIKVFYFMLAYEIHLQSCSELHLAMLPSHHLLLSTEKAWTTPPSPPQLSYCLWSLNESKPLIQKLPKRWESWYFLKEFLSFVIMTHRVLLLASSAKGSANFLYVSAIVLEDGGIGYTRLTLDICLPPNTWRC